MAGPKTLVENREGTLHLRGPLVFASVGAALALLVEWRKFAARHGLRLELRAVPAQLRALAAAAGLDMLCA